MDDKRQRIIKAAAEVFRRKGVEKTKIADITRDAGVALGTFYLYFPSKYSVMPEIAMQNINSVANELGQVTTKEDELFAQMEQFVDCVFKRIEADRAVFCFLLAGVISSDNHKGWESVYAPIYARIIHILAKHRDRGTLKPSMDIESMAKLLIGFIETSAEQLFMYNDNPSEEDICQKKRDLMDFIKGALTAGSIN